MKARTLKFAAVLLGSGLTDGCHSGSDREGMMGSAETAASADAAKSGMHPAMADHCPFQLEGLSFEALDTGDGISLRFAIDAARVEELRIRVEAMAAMMNDHQDMASMNSIMRDLHASRSRGCHSQGDAGMPAAWVTFTVLDDGAAIDLVPLDEADLDPLREHVRTSMGNMTPDHSVCPVMSLMG